MKIRSRIITFPTEIFIEILKRSSLDTIVQMRRTCNLLYNNKISRKKVEDWIEEIMSESITISPQEAMKNYGYTKTLDMKYAYNKCIGNRTMFELTREIGNKLIYYSSINYVNYRVNTLGFEVLARKVRVIISSVNCNIDHLCALIHKEWCETYTSWVKNFNDECGRRRPYVMLGDENRTRLAGLSFDELSNCEKDKLREQVGCIIRALGS